MRLRSLAVCLGFTASWMVSGCASGPAVYEKVLKELPASPEAPPPSGSVPSASKSSLTFEDCFVLALGRNERLAITGEDYFQATLLRHRAWAALSPEMTLRGTYLRQEDVAPPPGTVTQRFNDPSRLDYGLRVRQPLFNGFKDVYALRQIGETIQARRSTLLQERQNLLLNVAGAFYGALQAQQEVSTLEESVRLQQERLREVQARQRLGLARKTEVLLVETQATSVEARLVRARNALQTLRERLGLVIGAPVERPLVDSVQDGPLPADLGALVQAARAGRNDLKALEASVKAAQAQLGVVRGEFAPSVDLTGNYYLRRSGVSSDIKWDVLFTLDYPFFQGGVSRARYREAASKLRQARLLAQGLRRQIDVEVETAYLDMKASDALLKTLEAGFKAAEENYRLIQEEYRQGIGTNLEVLTAYTFFENARLDLDRERLNRKVLYLRLQTVTGGAPVRVTSDE